MLDQVDTLRSPLHTHSNVSTGLFDALLLGPPVVLQNGLLGLEGTVKHATGVVGLGIIFVYSFLIAIVLPLPSEIVLLAPVNMGLPGWMTTSLIIGVSAVGKAIGSAFALKIGNEAKQAGPVMRALNRTGIDVIGFSQRTTVNLVQKYGYIGLTLALCVPGFPDTLSIYAFSVLEDDYLKFALATFAGSVGRLVIWLTGAQIIYMIF